MDKIEKGKGQAVFPDENQSAGQMGGKKRKNYSGKGADYGSKAREEGSCSDK